MKPVNFNPNPRMTSGTDTCKPVPMNRRMNIIYSWLNENGVSLGTWSTDQTVDYYYNRMQECLKYLETLDQTNKDIVNMVNDLKTLMNRGTKNRIVVSPSGKPTVIPSQPKAEVKKVGKLNFKKAK